MPQGVQSWGKESPPQLDHLRTSISQALLKKLAAVRCLNWAALQCWVKLKISAVMDEHALSQWPFKRSLGVPQTRRTLSICTGKEHGQIRNWPTRRSSFPRRSSPPHHRKHQPFLAIFLEEKCTRLSTGPKRLWRSDGCHLVPTQKSSSSEGSKHPTTPPTCHASSLNWTKSTNRPSTDYVMVILITT